MESAECVVEKRWGPEQSMVNSGKNNCHKVYCKELPRNEVVAKWVNKQKCILFVFRFVGLPTFKIFDKIVLFHDEEHHPGESPPLTLPPKKDLRGNSGP